MKANKNFFVFCNDFFFLSKMTIQNFIYSFIALWFYDPNFNKVSQFVWKGNIYL